MSTVWQNAPAIALENGCFDGLTTIAELKRHGDLGIGAFDQLDGEMVGVDGVFYQVTADAVAHVPADDVTLPFCMVTPFRPGPAHDLPAGVSSTDLPGVVDEVLGTPNLVFSLRIDGTFRGLRTRCLPRQVKPFPLLREVAKTQPEFAYDEIAGTMVGYRATGYGGRITPPGHHLHFIATDRSVGGHVLSFDAAEATLQVDRIDRQEIAFPTTADFIGARLV